MLKLRVTFPRKKSNLYRLLWSSGAVVLLSPWSFVSSFAQKISKEGTRTPRRSSSLEEFCSSPVKVIQASTVDLKIEHKL